MTTTLSPMSPQRRAEIRSMLVDQVATETASARTTAQGRAARPGSSRLRPLAAGVAVSAASAALFLGSDLGHPTPSYASWEPVPVTAPGAAVTDEEIEEWASQCSDLGVGGVGIEGIPADTAAAASRDVLVDRRGDFTFCVDVDLGSGTEQDPLIAFSGIRADGTDADDGLNTMSGTVYDESFSKPQDGDVLVLGGDMADPQPATEPDSVSYLRAYQMFGLAGPDVDSVEILLSNGTSVTATVNNGLWGAWWPAEKGAASGTQLREVSGDSSRVLDPNKVALL
jgi:hypothetical protein